MGQIQRFTDATGEMSMTQRHDEDIDQIMGEINRIEDQLDAINRSVKIIARGKATLSYNGSPQYPPASFKYGGGSIGTFLCFIEPADEPGFLYGTPFSRKFASPGGIVTGLYASCQARFGEASFSAIVDTTYVPSPPNLTFYIYVLEQPADTTS